MTRKDYVLIADSFKLADSVASSSEKKGVKLAAIFLSHTLENDNHNFDRPRFLSACGIPESEH